VLLICMYLGGVAILSGGTLNGALESLARETKADHQEFGSELAANKQMPPRPSESAHNCATRLQNRDDACRIPGPR